MVTAKENCEVGEFVMTKAGLGVGPLLLPFLLPFLEFRERLEEEEYSKWNKPTESAQRKKTFTDLGTTKANCPHFTLLFAALFDTMVSCRNINGIVVITFSISNNFAFFYPQNHGFFPKSVCPI